MRTEGGRTAERQCAFTTGKCYGEGGAGRCAWWERKRERERERNVLFTLQKRCVYSMYIFFFFFLHFGGNCFCVGEDAGDFARVLDSAVFSAWLH